LTDTQGWLEGAELGQNDLRNKSSPRPNEANSAEAKSGAADLQSYK